MKIILPMAGNGFRFYEAGYDKPKPLIDVNGKPMFVRVLENIKYGTDIHVIVRRDHVEQYNIAEEVNAACPEATVYILEGPTEGAACTVLKAVDVMSDDGFLVANCDQLMLWDKQEFFDKSFFNLAGTIMTFESDYKEPIHSYVTQDEYGYMTDLKEKVKISDTATVGVYHFGSQKKFAEAAALMMKEDDRTNGEFYLAPVYNYMTDPVKLHPIQKMIGLGTPAELDALKASEWWDRLDEL